MASRTTSTTFEPVLGLTGLGLLASGGALAQTAPDVALPEIDVSTERPSPYRRDAQPVARLPTTVGETPQSITVVPRELIQERAATTVREALRNVTGISLAAGEGGFSGDNLTLRGFSARGDFFIDGIRDLGQYTRDPFYLKSIEVLKGPASVAFGRGSTGGVINQTTRLPRPGVFGEAWVSGYSPNGARATGDVNLSAGDVAVRMQAMASRINAAGRDHVHQERWGIAPSITWGINGPTQLTVAYLHQKEDNVPDYGVPYILGKPARVPRHTFYGVDGQDRETTETNVLTVRAQHRFDERLMLRNTFRWGNYDRDINATAPRINATTTLGTPYTPTTPLDLVLVRREPQVRTGFNSILVNQTEALVNVSTGPLRHNILTGIEVGRESSEAVRYAFPVNANGRPNTLLLTPNYYLTSPVIRNVASDIRTVATTFAAYAVDQIKIGEQFELLLGLRWDSFDADYVNRTATNPAQRNFSRLDTAFSWRTALVYKPIPSVRTYFAYGTSFNPSAESLTLAANNAALPPEEDRVLRDRRLLGRPGRPPPERLPVPHREDQRPHHRPGGEHPGAGRRHPRRWLRAPGDRPRSPRTGTCSRASPISSPRSSSPATRTRSARSSSTPRPTSVALWTNYNLPYDLQIGGGLSFVDYRYGNTTNTTKVPSYTRYDLAGAWAPTEGPLRTQFPGQRAEPVQRQDL